MAETLYATGLIGGTNGFKWIESMPDNGDIDGDDDGVMAPNHGALIDLSHITSELLGKQASQMCHYTLKRVWVSMRNKDDAWDNDESTYFAGSFRWYHPTDRRKDAMKLARDCERASESHQIDGDSFFLATDDDYSGFRFGWDDNDGAYTTGQVMFPTMVNISGHAGTEWGMLEVFRIYNLMYPSTKSNALWEGRAGNKSCKIPWSTSAATGVGVGDAPALLTDYNSGRINAKVLGGLLYFNVAHSSLLETGETIGGIPVFVDDDYEMHVGVEFSAEQGRF